MKIYSQKLGKVIDATPALFNILKSKGWVQVPDVEPIDAQVIELEKEIILDDSILDEPILEENPEQEQVKSLETKPKNKKRK
jgi:hypothetical protein